ncbi:homoserine O-acetyltransferase MetX [Allobacillus halotolerans]|uniref:Homoserine O-acetyltransferase n=1 Tax=Allobacillus halotolerans TaxID=570278 RepID=A0ABS6GS50_9BACI|nr:homoserine O-acetyltransferase [Allobacillus halotolerans]MBU6081947.1 homoserine O-acetyltransferase [Allobacillus halotolerans]
MTKTVQHGSVSIPNFSLESGEQLDEIHLAYEQCGPIDAPTILVCHALTGNQFAVGTDTKPGWWRGLIHESGYIDTACYQVITFNVLGGCDGSTGPGSSQPNGEPYQDQFPTLTVRDLVEAQFVALNILGIDQLKAVIGGSLGGMQVLEWGLMYPDYMEAIFPIAVTPVFSDYAIAFNHIAKQAILRDQALKNGEQPKDGLHLARMVGMVTYRPEELFSKRFSRQQQNGVYDVESYLNYQGEKLANRFNPYSYIRLLDAMNGHDITRGRGSYQQVLEQFNVPIFALAFQNDLLYPPEKIKRFVKDLEKAGAYSEYHEVETIFGHDGFLVEFEKWGPFIQEKSMSLETIKN